MIKFRDLEQVTNYINQWSVGYDICAFIDEVLKKALPKYTLRDTHKRAELLLSIDLTDYIEPYDNFSVQLKLNENKFILHKARLIKITYNNNNCIQCKNIEYCNLYKDVQKL